MCKPGSDSGSQSLHFKIPPCLNRKRVSWFVSNRRLHLLQPLCPGKRDHGTVVSTKFQFRKKNRCPELLHPTAEVTAQLAVGSHALRCNKLGMPGLCQRRQ